MYQYVLKLPMKFRLYIKIDRVSDSKEDVYLFQHFFLLSPSFLGECLPPTWTLEYCYKQLCWMKLLIFQVQKRGLLENAV